MICELFFIVRDSVQSSDLNMYAVDGTVGTGSTPIIEQQVTPISGLNVELDLPLPFIIDDIPLSDPNGSDISLPGWPIAQGKPTQVYNPIFGCYMSPIPHKSTCKKEFPGKQLSDLSSLIYADSQSSSTSSSLSHSQPRSRTRSRRRSANSTRSRSNIPPSLRSSIRSSTRSALHRAAQSGARSSTRSALQSSTRLATHSSTGSIDRHYSRKMITSFDDLASFSSDAEVKLYVPPRHRTRGRWEAKDEMRLLHLVEKYNYNWTTLALSEYR